MLGLTALGSLPPALQPDSSPESSDRSSADPYFTDPRVAAPPGQWTFHPGDLNCYDGHGAPGASGGAHAESISIEECKAACLREQIWVEECDHGAKNYELHTFAPAPLLPPPSPPPPPPFSISRSTAAGQINYRFRMGRPSDNLSEV